MMNFCRLCVSSSNDLIDLFGPAPKNVGDLDDNYKINLVHYINAMRAMNNIDVSNEPTDDGIICLPCGKRINELMNRTSKAYAFGNTVLKIIKPEIEPAMITKLYQEIHKTNVWSADNFEEATDEKDNLFIKNDEEMSSNEFIEILAEHPYIKIEETSSSRQDNESEDNNKEGIISFSEKIFKTEKCVNFKRETHSVAKVEEEEEEFEELRFNKLSLDACDIPIESSSRYYDYEDDVKLNIASRMFVESSGSEKCKRNTNENLYNKKYSAEVGEKRSSTVTVITRNKRTIKTLGREYETRSKKKKMDELIAAASSKEKGETSFKVMYPKIRVRKIETLLNGNFLESCYKRSFSHNKTDKPINILYKCKRHELQEDIDIGCVSDEHESETTEHKPLFPYPTVEKVKDPPLKLEYLIEILESYTGKVLGIGRNL